MKEKSGRLYWFIKRTMLITGLALAALLCIRGLKGMDREGGRDQFLSFINEGADLALDRIWRINYPAAAKENETEKSAESRGERECSKDDGAGTLLCDLIFKQSPVYRFLDKEENGDPEYQEADPAFAGYLESGKFYQEHQYLLYDVGEESGADGIGPNGTEALALNSAQNESSPGGGQSASPENPGNAQNAAASLSGSVYHKDGTMTCAASAIWPIVGTTYRKEQLADYDFLMKHFYTVNASTTAGRDLMKADDFLAEDFTLRGGNDKPQILIYHTHSQEAFADFGPNNKEATVVGIGSYLTKLLQAKGYNVIHDTSVYDLRNGKLDRNKAYNYSLEGVTAILQKNPSVEVLLDIHRDGVNENLHMVNQVKGKPTAPVMFFNGVSQTPEGPIEYLPNPYRKDNLAFSFQMQLDAAAYFPGMTRKIFIKSLRYNLHLRPRSVLIEVGAQTNTYQEALNAMEPLSEVLNMVLQGN